MSLTTAGTKTIKDSAGANVTVKTVVDSADSTTSPSHGIIDGLGNQFDPSGKIFTGGTVTRPADTTAYAAGDLVANSTTAGSVTYPTIQITQNVDQVMTLLRLRLRKTGTATLSGSFRIHLYRTQPTVVNGDNGVWSTNNAANYAGSFDVTITQSFTDGAVGIGMPTSGSVMVTRPVSGSTTLFYLIEARAAYTPASAEVFTPILEVQ
jgi:hypothetical protein